MNYTDIANKFSDTELSQNQLSEEVKKAKQKIVIGGRYVHYKDPSKIYTVLLLAISEKDNQLVVIYQAEYDNKITFVHPFSQCLEEIEKGIFW